MGAHISAGPHLRRTSMVKFLEGRLSAVVQAGTTAPTARAWLICGALYLAFILVILGLQRTTGFPQFVYPSSGLAQPFRLALGLFFHPSLTEEVIFRVLLMPQPREGALKWGSLLIAAASLTLFVLWHPINGFFFRKSAFQLFVRPEFLLAAACLGLVCTLAYWISGSLWPPVLMHWLTVSGWFFFFGARQALSGASGV
jgi:predicted Abi (CAAX) family protease